MEKAWARFTKQAGFKHQRRKRLTRWLLIVAFIVLAPLAAFAAFFFYTVGTSVYAAMRVDPVTAARMVVAIPNDAALQTLPNGAKYLLDSGAVLQPISFDSAESPYKVRLQGKAIFVMPSDSLFDPKAARVLSVQTKRGIVIVGGEVVEVVGGEDTTHVRVFGLKRDSTPPRFGRSFAGLLGDDPGIGKMVLLKQGERGRMVKGQRAEKLPSDSLPPNPYPEARDP